MASRPNFIDVRSESSASFNSDLPSPRAGEIPPALSPLDALALQGRLLAKRFEQEQKQGRRISRLPPLTIQNEFATRPGFFRSVSTDSQRAGDGLAANDDDATPRSALETSPEVRPKSHYPSIQMEGPSPNSADPFRSTLVPLEEGQEGYFNLPRSQSPDQLEHAVGKRPSHEGMQNGRQLDNSYSSKGSSFLHPSGSFGRSRSPAARSPRASPAFRSRPGDNIEDIEGLSLGNSFDSLPTRHFSTSSSVSGSHSPISPFAPPFAAPGHPRSPSISSEYSTGGTRLSRPAFNFSRPLSQQQSFESSRPWVETPSRLSEDSRPIATPTRQDSIGSGHVPQDVHTPVSMTSDDYIAAQDPGSQPAQSYIYSKYALPRGRKVERESMDAGKFLNQFFQDDGAKNQKGSRPPSPPSPGQAGLHRPRVPSIPSSTTASSNATIRPRTAQSIADMSPEEHLDQGIQCHEAGSLQKSTYHLRLAARAGHPTGMLLYALACRHGWGMRQNEAEGFQWLKKAVDSAQLTIADDEDQTKQGKAMDFQERKTHKARFALGIYELGKSYMEGWGVSQDRALALRCFEIAGNWGDADALTEAGYCYAEGLGCKKDLKKAAKFYREAATKGASMVGQSWIYKEKYMSDDEDEGRTGRSPRSARKDNSSKDKKARDKSRTRTIFGRKKSPTS